MFELRVKLKENLLLVLMCIITVFILLVSTGCSNKTIDENVANTSKTSDSSIEKVQDKDFENKVSLLRTQLDIFNRHSESFLPKEINGVNRACNEILIDLLQNKQSLSSTTEDILDDSNKFYLKFGNVINLDSSSFRVVEFGSSTERDGSMRTLFVQSWNENNEISVQTIDTIIQTASGVGKYIYYDSIELDGLYYTNILSSIEGVESNYFYLSSYKVDKTKIMKFHDNAELSNIKHWNLRKIEEEGKYIIGYESNRKYSWDFNDKNIVINALDDDEKIISSLKIVLSDEGYSFEEM